MNINNAYILGYSYMCLHFTNIIPSVDTLTGIPLWIWSLPHPVIACAIIWLILSPVFIHLYSKLKTWKIESEAGVLVRKLSQITPLS
jgi:hypothetical protein